ncbi:MAG TPA: nucleotide-binding protein [bacterium]|nr:nucleotide-binding protein [bacterium]
MLTDDEKNEIVQLLKLKVGKKCDKIAEERKTLLPAQRGMIGRDVYFEVSREQFEEVINYEVNTLLEIAKNKSVQKKRSLEDSDFGWIVNLVEEHIDLKLKSEQNQIEERFGEGTTDSEYLKEKIRDRANLLKQGMRRDVEIVKKETVLSESENVSDSLIMDEQNRKDILSDDDKREILKLVDMKTGEIKENITKDRKRIAEKQPDNRNPALQVAEDIEKEVLSRVDILIDLIRNKRGCIDDAVSEWLIQEIQGYIEKRGKAGEKQIERDLFSRGEGNRVKGPQTRLKDELMTIKLKARRKIEIAKSEDRIVKKDGDKSDMGSNVKSSKLLGEKIFIVHGHNKEVKETVARFIEKLGLEAIILHEQPSSGKTIIEKFETYSNVGYAIVLLTSDDEGRAKGEERLIPRARQNVIFEMGFFVGKIGRERVCIIYEEGVELPSDYDGVVYVPMDSGGAWKFTLAKEMKQVGFNIDMNKV